MSLRVELPELVKLAEGFGTVPMLLSTDPDGRPRAAAVRVAWDVGSSETGVPWALVGAGRKSCRNVSERRLVSLLWPAPPGERFALLVDADVVDLTPDHNPDAPGGGGRVTLRPTSAILHVVARTERS